MPDKIKELYDLVSDKGYFKDENELRTFAKDPKAIGEVYDLIKDDGYFKDKVEFDSYFSEPVKKKELFSTTVQDFTKPAQPQLETPLKSPSPLASNLKSASEKPIDRNTKIRDEIYNENPILARIGKKEDFNIITAEGRYKDHLEKTGRSLEYFPKGETAFPYQDNLKDMLPLDKKDTYRTLIDTKKFNDNDLKESVRLDFISHALHDLPEYNTFSKELEKKLTAKYGEKMVKENGGVDAYVRGYLAKSKEYEPYKKEMSFLGKEVFKPLDSLLDKPIKSEINPFTASKSELEATYGKDKTALDVMKENNVLGLERLDIAKQRLEKIKTIRQVKDNEAQMMQEASDLQAIIANQRLPYIQRVEAQNKLKGIADVIQAAQDEVANIDKLNEAEKVLIGKINTNEEIRQQKLENEYGRVKNLIQATPQAAIKSLTGMASIFNTLGLSGDPENRDIDREELKAQQREAIKKIDNFADSFITQETPQNYKEWFKGDFSAGKLGYLASQAISQTVPTVAAGFLGGAGGLNTFTGVTQSGLMGAPMAALSGAGLGFGESKQIFKEAGLDEDKSDWAALAMSIPLGLLEEYGVSDIIAKPIGKKIMKETSQEVIKSLGKVGANELTNEIIFTTTKKTLAKALKDYGKDIVESAWKEPLTEMTQAVASEGGRQLAEAYTGQDSNANQTNAEYLKEKGLDILGEGLSGALGGTGISAITSAFQSRTNPSAYSRALELKDPDLFSDFLEQLQKEVSSGIITEQQANLATENVKKIQEVDAKIPENIVGAERRSIAASLIAKKEELTQQIEGKDTILSKPILQEIEAIDNKLVEVAENKPIEQITNDQIKETETNNTPSSDNNSEAPAPSVVEKPTEEQIVKDIKEKNFVTFEYNNESEVPEQFKDKISSSGENNGKPFVKVTLPKSDADYELAKEQSTQNKEQEQVAENKPIVEENQTTKPNKENATNQINSQEGVSREREKGNQIGNKTEASNSDSIQREEGISKEKEVDLAAQKQDGLVNSISSYNKLSKNSKNRAKMLENIKQQADNLGFTLRETKGKLEAVNTKGKKVIKTRNFEEAIEPTQEARNNFKTLFDNGVITDAIESSVLEPTQIKAALEAYKKGKETKDLKRLINEVESLQGEVDVNYKQYDKATNTWVQYRVPLSEMLNTEVDASKLTEDEINQLSEAFDEQFKDLSEEQQNQLNELFNETENEQTNKSENNVSATRSTEKGQNKTSSKLAKVAEQALAKELNKKGDLIESAALRKKARENALEEAKTELSDAEAKAIQTVLTNFDAIRKQLLDNERIEAIDCKWGKK